MCCLSLLLAGVLAAPEAPAEQSSLADQARGVVAAVVRAAEQNQRLPERPADPKAARRLTGDELAEHYFRAAAAAARRLPREQAAAAFLMGLGIALDRTTELRSNPLTAGLCRKVESEAERQRRLAVLGEPTLRGRYDLALHFTLSGALAAIATPALAEAAGIAKEQRDMRPGGSGFSFADLQADVAGVAFAVRLRESPELLAKLAEGFRIADYLPDHAGLREDLTEEMFTRDYGSLSDERFRAELESFRKRIRELPGHRR